MLGNLYYQPGSTCHIWSNSVNGTRAGQRRKQVWLMYDDNRVIPNTEVRILEF